MSYNHGRGFGLNRTGQVRINFTGLTIVGFQAETPQFFPLNTATGVVHAWPTTVWESNNVTRVYGDIYNVASDRLRENGVMGQSTLWRINGNFIGKNLNNNGALDLQLCNPDSGFYTGSSITLPSARTSGPFTTFMLTIADNDSLAASKGYKLRAQTSFADAAMEVNITNIVRSSRGIENYGYVPTA